MVIPPACNHLYLQIFSFRLRHRKNGTKASGFSIVEIAVAVVLASILLLGGYRLLTSTTLKGSEAARNAKVSLDIGKFLDKLGTEIANIVVIWPGTATVLENARPSGCPGGPIPASVVPLPGYTKADLSALNDLTSIDPSSVPLASESDAIRFVYLTIDSRAIELAKQPSGAAYPTCQPPAASPTPVSRDCSGDPNNKIILKAESRNEFRKGDFAVISDPGHSDLIRVTNVSTKIIGTEEFIEIDNSPTISIWNDLLAHDYGVSPSTTAFLQKAAVVTYAFSPEEDGTIYRDSHEADDDFSPETGFPSSPSPSLAKNWVGVATNIQRLTFRYESHHINEATGSTTVSNARLVRAGEIGNKTDACSNQLGFPELRRIIVAPSATGAKDSNFEREIDAENLRHGISENKTAENLDRAQFVINAIEPPGGGGGGGGDTKIVIGPGGSAF